MTIRIQNNLNLGGLLPPDVTEEALQAGADHLRDVSRAKAPLLSGPEAMAKKNDEEVPGTLRESAYSRVIDDVTAEVGFTDFAAAWQHERMDYHHTDGQAKFLEEPLVTEKDRVLQIIADKLRQGMQS